MSALFLCKGDTGKGIHNFRPNIHHVAKIGLRRGKKSGLELVSKLLCVTPENLGLFAKIT